MDSKNIGNMNQKLFQKLEEWVDNMPKGLQNNLDYTKFASYSGISDEESQQFFQFLFREKYLNIKIELRCPHCKDECTVNAENAPKEFECGTCGKIFEWKDRLEFASFTYRLNKQKFTRVKSTRISSPLELVISNKDEGKIIELAEKVKEKKQGLNVFISYSHCDESFRTELDKHLIMLRRSGLINTWYDRKIVPGSKLNNEINQHLLDSDIVLLLISVDFLISDYCYEIEMNKALELNKKQEVRVVPIIVRECDWKEESPFKDLLALPTDGKSISKWDNKDEAYLNIVNGIKEVVRDINRSKASR